MGAGPRGQASVRGAEALEGAEELGHLRGVVAQLGGVLHPQLIALSLVVPTVLEQHELGRGRGEPGVLGEGVAQDRTQAESHADQSLLGVALHAARDVDIAARQGEGVDDGVVQEPELEVEIRAVADGDHGLADLGDVGLQSRVLVGSVLAHDGGVAAGAELDLLGLGHEGELALPGDRIDGATGGGKEGQQQDEAQQTVDRRRARRVKGGPRRP